MTNYRLHSVSDKLILSGGGGGGGGGGGNKLD